VADPPASGICETREYSDLDLAAHGLLSDVPLHDVWFVDLPGGGAGRTVAEVRDLLGHQAVTRANPVVRALFALRAGLGRLFGWDDESTAATQPSLDIGDELRARSLSASGAADGPFHLVYELERESLSEIRNRTVHAFLALALIPQGQGYRLYWAVYVAPVGRITALYMALIDPFRRWIVYPAILRSIRRGWDRRFAA